MGIFGLLLREAYSVNYDDRETCNKRQGLDLEEVASRTQAGNTGDALILTLRRLMSYIYGAPILDVSRSHTTTQHSR